MKINSAVKDIIFIVLSLSELKTHIQTKQVFKTCLKPLTFIKKIISIKSRKIDYEKKYQLTVDTKLFQFQTLLATELESHTNLKFKLSLNLLVARFVLKNLFPSRFSCPKMCLLLVCFVGTNARCLNYKKLFGVGKLSRST